MNMKVCVINRWSVGWDGDIPAYERVLDHSSNTVCYIVNEEGMNGLTETIKKNSVIETVSDINNLTEIEKAFEKIEKKVGTIDRVIALSEWDIINAGAIREKFGIQGINYQQALNVRDKVKMKTILKENGIKIPYFKSCESLDDIYKLIQETDYPIVIKPRKMASSDGVHIINNEQELNDVVRDIQFNDLECEQYCPGTVFHIDGLIKNNQLLYAIPARYTESPIFFNYQKPLGGISLNPKTALYHTLVSFAEKVTKTLEINNTQFHLEVIVDESQTILEPTFLEIGARVGGADIPKEIELIIGCDTIALQLQVELGEELFPLNKNNHNSAGYLIIPFPKKIPSVMGKNTSFKGKLPTLVAEYLRKEGDILDGTGGYLKIPARYVFYGNYDKVYDDIMTAIKEHNYTYK